MAPLAIVKYVLSTLLTSPKHGYEWRMMQTEEGREHRIAVTRDLLVECIKTGSSGLPSCLCQDCVPWALAAVGRVGVSSATATSTSDSFPRVAFC